MRVSRPSLLGIVEKSSSTPGAMPPDVRMAASLWCISSPNDTSTSTLPKTLLYGTKALFMSFLVIVNYRRSEAKFFGIWPLEIVRENHPKNSKNY